MDNYRSSVKFESASFVFRTFGAIWGVLGLKGLSEIEKFENSCRNVSHGPRYGQMWHFLPEINFEPFTLNPFSPVKVPEMAIFEGQFYSTDCVRPTRPNFDN